MTINKVCILIVSMAMLLNSCECFAAAAGAISAEAMLRARGEFNISYPRLLEAVESTLKEMNLAFNELKREDNSSVIEGIYGENKFHIYIYRITDATSEIEIRVGTAQPGKEKADKLLEAIREKIGQGVSAEN